MAPNRAGWPTGGQLYQALPTENKIWMRRAEAGWEHISLLMSWTLCVLGCGGGLGAGKGQGRLHLAQRNPITTLETRCTRIALQH